MLRSRLYIARVLLACILVSVAGGCASGSGERPTDIVEAVPVPSKTPEVADQANQHATAEVLAQPSSEPSEGSLLWTYRPNSFKVSPLTSATYSNGVIYVGASESIASGQLVALDAQDGEVLWTFEHDGHTPSTPTVSNETVYFGSEDHNVYALRTADGSLIWSFTTEGHVRSKPLVVDQRAFIDSQDGFLYALDATEGDLLWSVETDQPVADTASRGVIPVSPIASDGAVLIAGSFNQLMAFEMLDGAERWRSEVGGQVFASTEADESTLYVGSTDHTLYAVATSDGIPRWTFEADRAIASSPAVDGGTVFVGSGEGVLYALDAADGSLLWKYEATTTGLSSPVVESGIVYVGSVDGSLFAVDAATGAPLAAYELAENLNGKPPAVFEGILYVVTTNRSLYAIAMLDYDT